MRLKRLLPAGFAAALALGLTGCSVIETQTAEQRDVIGSAHVTTHICTENESGPGCGDEQADRGQLLLGYRIPWNTAAPATLTAVSDTTGMDLTLTRDQSYTDALEANSPTDDSFNWVGYRSGAYDDPADPATVRWTIDADFNLDQEADGSPFTGPFTSTTQIGFNDLTGAPAGAENDPVDCGFTPPVLLSTRARAAARRSARVRRQIRAAKARSGQRIAPFGSQCFTSSSDDGSPLDTRDLGIVHIANATVQAGSSVSIPFSVRFKGTADPVATFAMSGAAGIPGATFTPSVATFAPATDEAKQIDLKVDVPKATAPGIYPVTIQAALPSGQKRTRIAQLWVTPAPVPPAAEEAPKVLPPLVETLDDLGTTSLADLKQDGLKATIGCNTACVGTVDLLMYKPPAVRAGIARAVDTVLLGRVRDVRIGADGGKQDVVVQLSDLGRERLGRLRQFTLIVRTTARDVNSQQTPPLMRKMRLTPNCAGGEKPCIAR